ncbi:MAG: glycosyltransferase family 4 protein [Planctomycetota bacterium]
MRPKVLFVNEYGVLNGGERSFLVLLKRLQRDWNFHALIPRLKRSHDANLDHPGLPHGEDVETELAVELRKLGIPIDDLQLYAPDGVRLMQPEARSLLAEHLQKLQPDLVHCNSLAMSRLLGPVCNELQFPSVGYLRDIIKLSKRAMGDVNCIDQLIAVSEATRQFHVSNGLDQDRVAVVYNGVELPAKQHAETNRSRLQLAQLGVQQRRVLLFVGQLGMRKGIDLLIEIFSGLADEFDDLGLLIVGQRDSTKQEAIDLESQVRSLSQRFANRIHWLGRRDDVLDLMQVSTLLLHPARQEPLGRVILEAASVGLPVVSTRVGGTPEILTGQEVQSFMAESGDVDAFVKLTRRLLVDDSLRVKCGSELREIATSKFNPDQAASRLGQIYRDTLSVRKT